MHENFIFHTNVYNKKEGKPLLFQVYDMTKQFNIQYTTF